MGCTRRLTPQGMKKFYEIVIGGVAFMSNIVFCEYRHLMAT